MAEAVSARSALDTFGRMSSRSGPVRAMVLAVQVLDEVDLELLDAGLRLSSGLDLSWTVVTEVVGNGRAGDPGDRERVASWLRLAERVHRTPLDLLVVDARPVGLPRDHVLHPGPGWASARVLGGALDLGIGLADGDGGVEVVPGAVWRVTDVDPAPLWRRCRRVLEEMGALAARRWALSADAVLRPMGDCDVLTLLGSAALRRELAGTDGGMRAVVAPMRRRGWTRLSRLDPAFGPAAAMATEPADRGFVRPLLVTADEVVLAEDGGHTEISLRGREPAPHGIAARLTP